MKSLNIHNFREEKYLKFFAKNHSYKHISKKNPKFVYSRKKLRLFFNKSGK